MRSDNLPSFRENCPYPMPDCLIVPSDLDPDETLLTEDAQMGAKAITDHAPRQLEMFDGVTTLGREADGVVASLREKKAAERASARRQLAGREDAAGSDLARRETDRPRG